MSSKKIFIVDDNYRLLGYLENWIRNQGYEVRTADNGLSAVERLSDYSADIIFIDYFLPHINADRLCQIIRRMEHLKGSFLVVVSAAASELSLDAKAIQADAIIAKGTFKQTAEALMHFILNAGQTESANEYNNMQGKSILPRRMTRELLMQNSHLRAMLDSISEGILELHRGKIVYANPASERLLEKNQVSMLASYLPDLFEQDVRNQIKELIENDKSALIPHEEKTVNHENRKLLIKAYPLENGSETSIILITDMTALLEAQEKLEDYQQHLENLVKEKTQDLEITNKKLRHAQKMEAIGIIAGGIAHDLNNILSGIVSYPDLLLLEIPNDSPLRKPVETIKNSGEKAAAIVQDLLVLAGRTLVRDEVICLNDIIREYFSGPEPGRIDSHTENVRITRHLENNLPEIKSSSFQVINILTLLISNAVSSMIEGGIIRITTRYLMVDEKAGEKRDIPSGSYVMLKIEDNGQGISKNDLEHIFEPFYTKKKMGMEGTGLGMAALWVTVRDHNGHVAIESERGKGTVTRIYFPAHLTN